MNYDEYYQKCLKEYGKYSNKLETPLYKETVKVFQPSKFSEEYRQACTTLSEKVGKDFDNLIDSKSDNIMIIHNNIWKFYNQLLTLSREIVPMLQEDTYGCYLYVDKVYIYRTLKSKDRKSSYLWHHDNNPNEIVKNLIYLSDVNLDNSPFEYLKNKEGFGDLGYCTRRGPKMWQPAPNNSRHNLDEINHKVNNLGFKDVKVLGPAGTMISFNNNVIHRANPTISGIRDVVNIRVKPTTKETKEYISPKWTTSYESSGAVNPNPEIDWLVKRR